jgi:hypothetical protein
VDGREVQRLQEPALFDGLLTVGGGVAGTRTTLTRLV